MFSEQREKFLEPGWARALGFTGTCIVTRIHAGELEEEHNKVCQQFITGIPLLREVAAIPKPHMTFCWTRPEGNYDTLYRTVSQWATEQHSFPICIADKLQLFESYPHLPAITVKRTAQLLQIQQSLTVYLNSAYFNVSEERNPHLSLFYLPKQYWSTIRNAVYDLKSNITTAPKCYEVKDIEVVTFDKTGTQHIEVFPLLTK